MKWLIDLFYRLFSKEESMNGVNNQPKPEQRPIDSLTIDTTNSRPWQYIIIHHSATIDGLTNDWRGIEKWHTGKSGSSDPRSPNYNKYCINPMRAIGYHFGLEFDETRELVYRIGRPLGWIGGHCLGFNEHAIGICIVGNFDHTKPRSEQLVMAADLVIRLQKLYKINSLNVLGHKETYPLLHKPVGKSCPGRLLDLDQFRGLLK